MRMAPMMPISACLLLLCAVVYPVLAQLPVPGVPTVQVEVTLPPVGTSVTPLRVFLYTATQGWHHESIETAVPALEQVGAQRRWVVFHTNDYRNITEARLNDTDVLVFLLTTGSATNGTAQKLAIERYIARGGGWVGIHSASDTEYDWQFYGETFLGGQYFVDHPAIQPAKLKPSPALSGCVPSEWTRTDEWYNFKGNPAAKYPDIEILLTIDESSYKGGTTGAVHPMAWRRSLAANATFNPGANATGSRIFYTALGHGNENYTSDSIFLPLVVGAIEWAGKRRSEICLFNNFSSAAVPRLVALLWVGLPLLASLVLLS